MAFHPPNLAFSLLSAARPASSWPWLRIQTAPPSAVMGEQPWGSVGTHCSAVNSLTTFFHHDNAFQHRQTAPDNTGIPTPSQQYCESQKKKKKKKIKVFESSSVPVIYYHGGLFVLCFFFFFLPKFNCNVLQRTMRFPYFQTSPFPLSAGPIGGEALPKLKGGNTVINYFFFF